MYQKTTVVGYLGQDPEMKYMPNGTEVTNFSVATSRKYPNKDGDIVDETTWFRCSAFGKNAENINKFFEKGKPILVEGRIRPDPQTGGPKIYERNDGTAGASFELNVVAWSFLPDTAGGGGNGYDGADSKPAIGATEDDEIPF